MKKTSLIASVVALFVMTASSYADGGNPLSIGGLPEGVYGTNANDCGFLLRRPPLSPNHIVLEAVTNPRTGDYCSSAGDLITFAFSSPTDLAAYSVATGNDVPVYNFTMSVFSADSFLAEKADAKSGKPLAREIFTFYRAQP